ncbi:hypothetical protein BLOT_001720 [Blomia tropicalis]|nr:hypothetical protein BLOT_001720 [Blomia tropicalis]
MDMVKNHANIPATHAVMKLAIVPVIIARTANCARSDRLAGAMALSPPTWMPMDDMLAKLHNANVAIVSERFEMASFVINLLNS